LRLEDTDQDDLVAMYVEAAEQSLAYVGRALKPASYALDIYGFARHCIELPMPPLRSVTAVKAPGTDGVLAAINSSNYLVTTTSEGRGRIDMATAYAWPASAYSPGWVTASVEFTAGYDIVPSALRAAILLIVGTLFENRSGASPIPMTKLPYGVDALVGTYREMAA
jgi:uncharacterized phiE125 gp8 family phage protein